MSRKNLCKEIDHYQIALIWVSGLLIATLSWAIPMLIASPGAQENAVKEFIKKQNESTLESCREDADECHIEFVYDEDGNLLGGNVVGQSRK